MHIEQIHIHRLRVPLRTPYRLSFGPVDAFDTVLIEMRDRDGHSGIGEATYLTGYTDETIAASWTLVQRLGREYAGLEAGDITRRLQPHFAPAPFTATAFKTALEMAANPPLLRVEQQGRVPVRG